MVVSSRAGVAAKPKMATTAATSSSLRLTGAPSVSLPQGRDQGPEFPTGQGRLEVLPHRLRPWMKTRWPVSCV